MQEPASVSDLFQQINSLRNEMELARQSNQEEAAEYEKDIKEIEHLKQKEEHLRVKNDEKVRKKMAVEVQLQTKRTLLSFTRQVLSHPPPSLSLLTLLASRSSLISLPPLPPSSPSLLSSFELMYKLINISALGCVDCE